MKKTGLEIVKMIAQGYPPKKIITMNGYEYNWDDYHFDYIKGDRCFTRLILLKHLNEDFEIIDEILDKKEKEYLSKVIEPFRNEILYLVKYNYDYDTKYQYLAIRFGNWANGDVQIMSFPTFKTNTMYKKMKLNKKYSLEVLNL